MEHPLADKGYADAVAKVVKTVEFWLATHEAPRFRFPAFPMIADLEQIGGRLALNDSARQLVGGLIRLFPADKTPTVLQLEAALKYLGVACESCSFGDLGLNVGQT